ncbi:MAG: hypothetical protein JNN20_09790 [Betaproteobacteria bacterium]|nr:hypothetical protein [Betaproteobacteria bacterium]
MTDYIFLMHNDAESAETDAAWEQYLHKLRASGQFEGGSAIGSGECFVRQGQPVGVTAHLSGYILVRAESLSAARMLLDGNPVFEAGGTVEIRELPRQ